MSNNAYILHMADRTEEDHTIPPPPHDPYPQHPLGTFITIRILSPNTDPLSSTEFDTTWEYIRTRQSFANIMAGGQGWWWEESQKWLQPKEFPDEIGLKNGHTVRIVFCKDPEGEADVLDVEFEKKKEKETGVL